VDEDSDEDALFKVAMVTSVEEIEVGLCEVTGTLRRS
jgi:hypothetical protein